MDLTLSGEFAKHILSLTKKDSKLAHALAHQFLNSIEPAALAEFLFTTEVAIDLLAERIKNNPEAALRELQDLPLGIPVSRRGRRPGKLLSRLGRKPAAGKGKGSAIKIGKKRRKRQRLTPEKVEQLKNQVRFFLNRKPESTRKQIINAVPFPSVANYNRIIAEMKEAGAISSQGEKSKTVYRLKSASGKKRSKVGGAQKSAQGKKAKGKKKKEKKKKANTSRMPLLCPVAGCQNRGAPVFGMLCKDHKDIPKAERDKLFEERRQAIAQE